MAEEKKIGAEEEQSDLNTFGLLRLLRALRPKKRKPKPEYLTPSSPPILFREPTMKYR